MIDGRLSTSSLTDSLDYYEPNLILATADKSFPAFLADYGETNHLEVVNVFDVKNDLYEDNPSMVQILTPSALFNEQIVDKIAEDFSDYRLLLTGVEDGNDAVAEMLVKEFPEDQVVHLSHASLAEYPVTDNGKYLIYSYDQKRDDVHKLLESVTALRKKI